MRVCARAVLSGDARRGACRHGRLEQSSALAIPAFRRSGLLCVAGRGRRAEGSKKVGLGGCCPSAADFVLCVGCVLWFWFCLEGSSARRRCDGREVVCAEGGRERVRAAEEEGAGGTTPGKSPGLLPPPRPPTKSSERQRSAGAHTSAQSSFTPDLTRTHAQSEKSARRFFARARAERASVLLLLRERLAARGPRAHAAFPAWDQSLERCAVLSTTWTGCAGSGSGGRRRANTPLPNVRRRAPSSAGGGAASAAARRSSAHHP